MQKIISKVSKITNPKSRHFYKVFKIKKFIKKQTEDRI